MRRTKHVLLLLAGAALVVVSVAAATRSHPQTSDVSASFTTSQTRMQTRTCTEGSNTFRVTNAVWRGTSTSTEPRLDGDLVIRTHTVLNETTGDGWLSGTWHTQHSRNQRSNAHLSAVIDNSIHVDGLANGEVHRPGLRLLGNFSATIVGSTLAGELGANVPIAPDNSALLYHGG